MTYSTMYKKLLLHKSVRFLYSHDLSKLFIRNGRGTIVDINLPSFYFSRVERDSSIEFLFTNKFFFKSFVKCLLSTYNILIKLYFIKIKMSGLGYRLRELVDGFYYFFFNYTNFFYFYPPTSLKVRVYKKRMILVSHYWYLLRLIVSDILILKSLGVYNSRGLRLTKQFFVLKKSGKKI